MPMMHSLRDLFLNTTHGHAISVKAKTPVMIPRICLEDAYRAGMALVDEADLPVERVDSAEPVGDDRDLKILEVIEDFVDRSQDGETGLFSGSGAPAIAKLSAECGFKVNGRERDKIWTEYRQSVNGV